MKKTILTLAVLFALTACRQNNPNYPENTADSETSITEETRESPEITKSPEATTPPETTEATTPPETTEATTPPKPIEPVNDIAERYYNLLTENKSVWLRQDTYGCTLLDVDFDGVPEVVTKGDAGFLYYKINGDKLEYFTELKLKCFPIMALYTDENGKKSWVIAYDVSTTNGDTVVSSEFRLSLFSLTGSEFTETVKFAEKAIYKIGGDIYELFSDGKEFTGEKEDWTAREREFEESLVPAMYHIASWTYAFQPRWAEVDRAVFDSRCAELANAYVTDDKEYLCCACLWRISRSKKR